MADQPTRTPGELLLYTTADGASRVECRFVDESLWMTQAQLAVLYQTTPQNITQHLRTIYDEGELPGKATCKRFLQVQSEGGRQVSRRRKHYSLEAILAVGYRVRSTRGTQFRQWATARLKEYLVKGFTMDDRRLKSPPGPGVPDYFDELLERVRDIRASEQRMYRRVRDLFALSADYDGSNRACSSFFATMQNKLHYAVTGRTAAEIIRDRADRDAPHMGSTSWRGDHVLKADAKTAKNYLDEDEIRSLNRVVSMWLDHAEDRAERRQQIYLKDWESWLDRFLELSERPLLYSAGQVSAEQAREYAETEYAHFAERRRQLREAEGQRYNIEALRQAARSITDPQDDP